MTKANMKKKVKYNQKSVSMMSGEMMWLLAINYLKQVPLLRVISFENSSLPTSMFSDDGIIIQCKKPDWMHKLEECLDHDKVTSINYCDTFIVDASAEYYSIFPRSNNRFIDIIMPKHVPKNRESGRIVQPWHKRHNSHHFW